jgi:hypothetical protein
MSGGFEQDGLHWLDSRFWDDLDQLESRHQRIQIQHEGLRRDLEVATRHDAAELREVWKRYCDVIAELDRTTVEFENLRARAG